MKVQVSVEDYLEIIIDTTEYRWHNITQGGIINKVLESTDMKITSLSSNQSNIQFFLGLTSNILTQSYNKDQG